MKKSILYFIPGPCATAEESADAKRIEDETGIKVSFRNAQWAQPGDDNFSAYVDVVGSVPSFYDLSKFKVGTVASNDDSGKECDTECLDEYMAATRLESESLTPLEQAAELPPVAVSPLKRGRKKKE